MKIMKTYKRKWQIINNKLFSKNPKSKKLTLFTFWKKWEECK